MMRKDADASPPARRGRFGVGIARVCSPPMRDFPPFGLRASWARAGSLALFSVVVFGYVSASRAQGPAIVEIELADIIHPISRDYVTSGIQHAADINARAVLIRLDTPGGLLDSTREMVEAILASKVPVIIWVGPSGVRAASAGFFILLSADLALMASGTNTGAASPVAAFGGDIPDTMQQKVENDASAFLRSYTARRGRNAELAERAVTEAEAFTAEEALANNLIDGIVPSVPALIDMFDGTEVVRFDGTRQTLALRGATVEVVEMTARQRLLSTIMNPNIALVLGVVGLLGLYIEVTHPGIIFPGVIGGISLILSLYAFNLLPVSLTGVLLILLAIALFVVEATVPSSGILAMGGVVSMVAGGLMLVEGPIPQLRVQLGTVLAIAVPMAVITVFLVRLVFLSQRKKSVTGSSGMVGRVGMAVTDIQKTGKILVHGEYWAAHSAAPIRKDSKVRVVGIDGLNLEVENEEE